MPASSLARVDAAIVGAVFGVGTSEMVVVAIVALLLFSPKELPRILRTAARFWGQLRATADEFKDTIMHADGVDELQEMVRGTHAELRTAETEARREMMKARAQLQRAQRTLAMTNKAKQERLREGQNLPSLLPGAESADRKVPRVIDTVATPAADSPSATPDETNREAMSQGAA